MRTFITKLTSRFSPKITGLSIALLALLTIPASVLAYGPERPTFTQSNPADYVTFNSITNNPTYGDERNFMRVRDVAAGTQTGDVADIKPGKEYEVNIFFHNNAKSSLNASGQGVAQNAYARTELPAVIKKGGAATSAMAYVGASNANPKEVYDYIDIKNNTAADMVLHYVPGSATIHSQGSVNNSKLPDSFFKASGAPIGYNTLGTLPGCNEFAGYITYRFVADQANFTFKKDVRPVGSTEWKDSATVKPGDKVEYLLSYKNTGTTEQKDIMFKDILPKGLNYVAGTSKLTNGNNPNGLKMTDHISQGGLNVGDYLPNGAVYLVFQATVDPNAPCSTLTNIAEANTNNGNRTDTANVLVTKDNCTPAAPVTPGALPTTGPAEVIAGLIGVAAITLGVIYYIKSRKDLDLALHDAQSQNDVVAKLPLTAHKHEDKK